MQRSTGAFRSSTSATQCLTVPRDRTKTLRSAKVSPAFSVSGRVRFTVHASDLDSRSFFDLDIQVRQQGHKTRFALVGESNMAFSVVVQVALLVFASCAQRPASRHVTPPRRRAHARTGAASGTHWTWCEGGNNEMISRTSVSSPRQLMCWSTGSSPGSPTSNLPAKSIFTSEFGASNTKWFPVLEFLRVVRANLLIQPNTERAPVTTLGRRM